MKPIQSYLCVCGVEHVFSLWVYAHWNIKITHKCDVCGQVNILLKGKKLKNRGKVFVRPIEIDE
jgi:hypothetical protein